MKASILPHVTFFIAVGALMLSSIQNNLDFRIQAEFEGQRKDFRDGNGIIK
jgi:hypothetical protein